MSYAPLFESTKIGSLKLKNRLVMPPMVRNYATEQGFVTDRYVKHIEQIAKGGVGLLILEASYVCTQGKGFSHQLGIHTDDTIVGLKRLVEVVHKQKTAIGIQLYHAGRQTTSSMTGMPNVGPSEVADPTTKEVPHVLTQSEIHDLVNLFADAAARAKKAGFDFVEIHGAHGYLITQFLSSFSNKRTDGYGDSLTNRMRFGLEVIEAVRTQVGNNFPILLRLSGEEMVKGGITIDETKKMAVLFEKAGVDALHISVGNYASYPTGHMIPPMAIDDGILIRLASEVKSVVSIPVITVGKIRTPEMAVSILENNQADLIAIGRTLLADPQWPNKVKEGRLNEINPCIACNQSCISRLFLDQDVSCTVNPACGREELFAKKIGKRKKIVIVGGGAAGLSAAKTAAMKGHKVTLCERTKQLGGQLNLVSAAPYRRDWTLFQEALIRDIKRLNVHIKLNKTVTSAVIRQLKPDAVIVAIGSSAKEPNLFGHDRPNVFNAREVLSESVKVKGDVVIIGGGCGGAQTAEYLANKGHNVSIVEAGIEIANDSPIDERALLLGRLKKMGVKMLTETVAVSIGEKSVVLKKNKKTKSIPMRSVVLCLGSFPNNGLTSEISKTVKKVVVVGDALDPRRVNDAVCEGALAVLSL